MSRACLTVYSYSLKQSKLGESIDILCQMMLFIKDIHGLTQNLQMLPAVNRNGGQKIPYENTQLFIADFVFKENAWS